MTLNQWELLHSELKALFEEFISKWRKNDFRFKTEKKANDDRITAIINLSVRKITHNSEVKNLVFKNEDKGYIDYMEATGFYEEAVYYRYIQRLIDDIEKIIKTLES